ncbi:Ribonucleoside-diphosphate reductase subunit beta [compost metagenome]
MLFEEQIARKPNLYPWTQTFIDKIWAGFWTPNEFDFKSDYHQFKKEMPENEKQIVVKTLSAIGQVEIAVKRFWANLGDNFPHPSMYDLGYAMANTEVIHNQAYEKLLDVLKLEKAFKENLEEPVVKGRVEYLRKYLNKVYADDDKKQYIYAVILFTLFVENVSLFSQFYNILWFNRSRNKLKDTAQQVQYTRNEEMLHALVGIKIINTLREEYPELFDADLEARIFEECNAAFAAESQLIDWMLGDFKDEGISAEILKEFIKDRINQSLVQIGYGKAFDIDDALIDQTMWFNEELLGNNMTDFFVKRPVEYSKKSRVFDEDSLF